MNYLPEVLTEYRINTENELSIDVLLKYGYYKIADAVLKPKHRFIKNPEVNPIQYNVVKGLEEEYKSYRELIYALVIDGKIVKIGGTYTGMKKRHGSYNCGTRKARAAGTCSVTNFNITETQYTAIREDRKVEWYVFDVPLAETTISLKWGDTFTYNAKTFYKYESSLCAKYEEWTGHFPILSSHAGIE